VDVTADDVKAWLDAGGKLPITSEVIEEGTLSTAGGGSMPYQLHFGWDLAIANLCDGSWGAFNVKLLRHIRDMKVSDDDRAAILDGVQIDDHHWRWFNKSLAFHSDEYKWFFVMAESYPQAACLIYHPKPSAIDAANIFYIEYLAVAPWNRENPLSPKVIKGLGPLIIQAAMRYAVEKLAYRPGYSLHALPKAVAFYERMGMLHIPQYDKEGLPFFEMPEERCTLREAST